MKKAAFTMAVIWLAFVARAQVDTSQKYFKSPYIPAFKVSRVPDSSSFTGSMLQKNKPTILVFFDPDCDHCQEATKNLIANIDKLKNVQILMVTIMDFSRTKKFYKDYKIRRYKNIAIYKDVTYDLVRFYNVSAIPDVYVYDNTGKLLNHYIKAIPVEEIAALF